MVVGAGGVTVVRPGHVGATVAMLCVGLAAAWIVGTVACQHVHKRLHSLREAADACVRGDLSTVINRPPDDDFFKLSDSVERILAQLKETCEEEDRLRRQLTRSEKLALIGELAATVAHEVNNPLDGLQNSTRIIRRNLDHPEQVRQLLDLMDSGLYRIEMIVRRLLTMSRDEPVCPVPTRMDEIVDDALMFTQPKLSRYGVELVRDFPDTPVFANADRVQMAQVLINLMINATDAMRSGGRLTVRCRMGNHGQAVLLDVIDTGSGIAPEQLPHIFDPFYSTKGKGGGTGLGLTVVRRIIEAHRGTVEVESQVNQGTRFRVILPATLQSLAVPQAHPYTADLARSRTADSQTTHVQ
jgi:signal transduction histidine kinase